MDLSNFFRFAYWLDPATNALPPSPRLWLAVVAGLVWAVCGLIGPLSNATPRTVRLTLSAVANILAGLLFSAVSVGRILALPILGWRIGWLVAGVIALLPAGWRWLQLAKAQRLLAHALQTLAFAPLHQSTIALPWPLLAPWLIGHMLGMAITTSIHRWPLWVGWLLIGFMLLPVAILISPDGLRTANRQFRTYMQGIWDASILSGANSDSRSRRTGSPSKSQFWHTSPRLTVATLSLAPLVLVYATVALRVLTGLINYLSAGEYRVPEPYSTIFNPTLALLVAVGYGFVLSARAALAYDRTLIKVGAAAMVVLSLGWSIWMALRLRTHGVSGSDPYAYTQMGVDLVTRGTLFHPFPLVRLTYALEIPSEPVMHIGYKLPIDVTRTAPTVWPPGYAIFTGLAYLIGGETGVFVLAPILSLFSLLIVAWLTREIMRSESPRPTLHAPRFTLRALPTVALTVLLTATSYQQIEWQLIPMADIAAQLFSLLALTLSLRYSASNQPPTTNNQRSIALAGLCIGIAFGIRYTQVLIAPAIALALFAHQVTKCAKPTRDGQHQRFDTALDDEETQQ